MTQRGGDAGSLESGGTEGDFVAGGIGKTVLDGFFTRQPGLGVHHRGEVFVALFRALTISGEEAAFDLVEQVGELAHVGRVTHRKAAGVVDHHERIARHLDPRACHGDDGGHGGGEAFDAHGDVAACLQGMVDGKTIENLTARRVDGESDRSRSRDAAELGEKIFGADTPRADLVVDGDFSGGFGGGGVADGEPGLAGHAGGRMSKDKNGRQKDDRQKHADFFVCHFFVYASSAAMSAARVAGLRAVRMPEAGCNVFRPMPMARATEAGISTWSRGRFLARAMA